MIVRARTLFPGVGPVVDDGALGVCGDRIGAVGKFREVARGVGGVVVDLGEVLLFPGLVNAHCHLDYTAMAGKIAPTRSFTEWIKGITGLKGTWGFSEYALSWLEGARMLGRGGTTTVGDVEAVSGLPADVWSCTPLRVRSFFEMTGVKSRRDPRLILEETVKVMEGLATVGGKGVGLSPHAPYSTTPELLRLTAACARARGWRRMVHVAESEEEYRMYTEADGPMFQWLRRNERDMGDCGGVSPVQRLARLGVLGPDLVAVHVNYLRDGDAELLAGAGVSVVHCPRSHGYFGHQAFPYETLVRAGVRVCLGTDSLATTRREGGKPLRLDMLAEMRAFAARHPGVSASAVVGMGTREGAWALGMGEEVGVLAEGRLADGVAIPFRGARSEAAEAILAHEGEVLGSMIGGAWVVEPGEGRGKAG